MTAKTTKERVQALRKRRDEAGLSEVRGIWAPAEMHADIRATAAKFVKRRTVKPPSS